MNSDAPAFKKPKIEESSSTSAAENSSPLTVFDASKVAQLIQKIADRLDNGTKNVETPKNDNIFENMSKKSDKLSEEEVEEAKNRSIDDILDLDEAKRYVLVLRRLLQKKELELNMAELKNFDSKKEIDAVNSKLNIITKKMENFRSLLTPQKPKSQKSQIQRHTDPLDVTCPEILAKFLDPINGQFDEIAYELVINAYEKFYLEFEQDIKNLDDEDLEKRKKSMRRLTNTQYWAWRGQNFDQERCQHFLVTLLTLQFYNTTNQNRILTPKNTTASEICVLESSARKAAYIMLEHGGVDVVDYGRDMENMWAGRDVQVKAQQIASNTARGLWSDDGR